MIYITEVRMEPPATDHGHIAAVKWVKQDSPEGGESTRVEMVEWIGDRKGVAFVRNEVGKDVEVRAIRPKKGRAYIRTYADGVETDNLLALPRYGMEP